MSIHPFKNSLFKSFNLLDTTATNTTATINWPKYVAKYKCPGLH